MKPIKFIISAKYSEFETFLTDFLLDRSKNSFNEIKPRERKGNDFSKHLEYVIFGALVDFKIFIIEDGLDIILSASNTLDERFPLHINDISQAINNDFSPASFPVGFKYFILNTEHSEIMENLWIESKKTQEVEAYLSTIVLLGSILEGLLLYKIKASNENQKLANKSDGSPKEKVKGVKKVLPLSRWTLRDMIIVSRECGWINEYSYNYSESLRKHRNFVHPFQQLEETFSMPNVDACDLSRKALEAIFKDLLRDKQTKPNTSST